MNRDEAFILFIIRPSRFILSIPYRVLKWLIYKLDLIIDDYELSVDIGELLK